MDFLEKDLEDIIFNSDRETLDERGLYIEGKMLRQVRIGSYGIADLITYHRLDGNLQITIYELKKALLDEKALLQLFRYKAGIKDYLIRHRNFFEGDLIIKTVLIGREIDCSTDWVYLLDSLEDFYVYEYQYLIDGIEFTESYRTYFSNNNNF